MRNKHPIWTKEEDKFAINFLKENPDLHCLAKEIARKRNMIFTEQFWHNVRCRSSKVWKLNLKKARANKGLNETMFHKGLCPWNKGETKKTDLRLMEISRKARGHKHSILTIKKLEKIAQERARDLEWRKKVSNTQFKTGDISPYSVAIFITKKCPICGKYIRIPYHRGNQKYHKNCYYKSSDFRRGWETHRTIQARKQVSERYNNPIFLYKWVQGTYFKDLQLTDLDKEIIRAKVLLLKFKRRLENEQKSSGEILVGGGDNLGGTSYGDEGKP